jgi:hypothetical protein
MKRESASFTNLCTPTSEHKHANQSNAHCRLGTDRTSRTVPDWGQRGAQVRGLPWQSRHVGEAAGSAPSVDDPGGVIEVTVAVLYLIPRTAFLGAILTTGHLGGALWTHLRFDDTWFFPIIVGVLMWLGLALRRPEIFRLLLGQGPLEPRINDAAQR